MYTSYIGEKFLKLYNKRNKTDYTAEQFFDHIIFPLFFNSEKHFLNVANSSFFQSIGKKELESGRSIHELKLERFHKNVKNDGASLTTLVGYASQDIYAGTSGQLSSLGLQLDEDEMYASWIGSGLSIAMGGGYSMFVDDEIVLMSLFEGWQYYRQFLNQTPILKGNQIDVWNSYWICHSLSSKYISEEPLDYFSFPDYVLCKADKWKKLGFHELNTNKWTNIILSLGKKFSNKEFLTVNAFKFADMNQTLGFINIYIKEINELYKMRDRIIINKDETILSDNDITKFEPFYYFKDACTLGSIGLKALEPAKLREFMPKGSVQFAQGKDYKFQDEESYFNYKLFKIWIYAMLNKKEIIQLADQLALILLNHELSNKEESRGKTGKGENVKKVIESRYFKEFAENIKPIINKENSAALEEIVQMSYLEIASDNFPLFLTLVRFQYQIHKSKS